MRMRRSDIRGRRKGSNTVCVAEVVAPLPPGPAHASPTMYSNYVEVYHDWQAAAILRVREHQGCLRRHVGCNFRDWVSR